jgi:hypothetical protein
MLSIKVHDIKLAGSYKILVQSIFKIYLKLAKLILIWALLTKLLLILVRTL